MRIQFVAFFLLCSLGSSASLKDVGACYEGLRPYLGVKRLHLGKGTLLIAAGTRGTDSGFYTFGNGKLRFHTLPRISNVEEANLHREAMESFKVKTTAGDEQWQNYYLELEVDGKPSRFVFTKSAYHPGRFRAEGSQRRFISDSTRPGIPKHVTPPLSVEVKADDAEALRAFENSVASLLQDTPRSLQHRGGVDEADLKTGVAACLKTFPKGTPIGATLLKTPVLSDVKPGGGVSIPHTGL